MATLLTFSTICACYTYIAPHDVSQNTNTISSARTILALAKMRFTTWKVAIFGGLVS